MRVLVRAAVPAALAAVLLIAVAGPGWAAPRAIDDSCPARTPAAGFFDVRDDSTHVRAVDCVVHWRVALGTSENRYSPAQGVTRGQMATFLARLVTRSGGALPTGAPDAFDDDDGTTHESSINALAAAKIVSGRGGRTYRPAAIVTRDQMAALLVRAVEYRTGTPLAGGPNAFDDDDGLTHERDIDRAAAAGLAAGTGTRLFSPYGEVRRDQMATFLARTLDKLVQDGVSTAPPSPALDDACYTGEVERALCEFVNAVQTGDLSTLSAEERAVAADADDLPDDPWTVTSCELEGDVTVLCEIRFSAPPPQGSEPTSAGFYLQPANGEYDGDGGVTVPPGEQLRYAVVDYLGLGVGGTFGS